jgi:spore maturation protein CgeB
MEILLVGPVNYGYSESILIAFKSLGYKAILYPAHKFYTAAPYWKRKLYKLGAKSFADRYALAWEKGFFDIYEKKNPDIVIFLNGDIATERILSRINHSKIFLWMWDGLCRYGENKLRRLASYLDKIAVFEHDDLRTIKTFFPGQLIYLPLGYDEFLYPELRTESRYWDITFIGMPSPERLEILDCIAKYANDNNKNMLIGGIWYDTRWPWKKIQFRKRHPYLYKYIKNKIFSLEEVADIYKKTKICINISVSEHKSINPRTFEILASGALQIMNIGQKSYGNIRLGKDVIEFHDSDDLIKLISYYLSNEMERYRIVKSGYIFNEKHNKMSDRVKLLMRDDNVIS